MGEHKFPKRTDAQATGEMGMSIVALLVRKKLGWEFRRTPQEADFGIDGYIDVVSPEGYMTGKAIAVQVKSGPSYFAHESSNNWTYRGELKHANYYMNVAMPVLLLIVDTRTDEAWWLPFDPNKTEGNKQGWTIAIPKSNTLSSGAKRDLLSLVGPGTDYLPALEALWIENDKIKTSPVVIFKVDREHVEACDVEPFVALFHRLSASPALLLSVQNKVDFLIDGYNDDPRELFEVPEVRRWLVSALAAVDGLVYFLRLGSLAQTIVLICQCLGDAFQVGDAQATNDGLPPVKTFHLRNSAFADDFLHEQFTSLNKFAVKHSLDQTTVDGISKQLAERLVAILRGELT